MKDKWQMPGTSTEPGGALAAFGFDTVEVTRITAVDPAVSEKQRKFMAVCAHDPAHARGQCPEMAPAKLREFSRKPKGGY